jgi:hypothetical protein
LELKSFDFWNRVPIKIEVAKVRQVVESLDLPNLVIGEVQFLEVRQVLQPLNL